jgi:serine/threonine-protein kinase
MGAVYLAEDARLGRKVALKLLAPELAGDPAFRDRFLRESRLAASLDHQHIVPVYEAGESDGQLYIAMRYVEGEDLGALLEREGALSAKTAVDILSKVASALDAAHGRGLVHRDVKPGNVLLSPPDQVYLSDFGLTKRTGSGSVLTRTGQVVGTLDYLAPEQIEGEGVDGRVDQYSLACLAYHCLTGEVPFRKDTEAALLYAHLRAPPPKATARRPELPEAVDRVIARGMAKRPQDRYPSCGELAAALRSAVAPERVALSVQPRRRTWLAVGAGMAVLLMVGLILALILSGGDKEPARGASPTAPATAGPATASPAPTARAFTEQEERLLERVPEAFRETCQPAEAVPPEALGGVSCTDGEASVTYSLFETVASMDDWFDQSVGTRQLPDGDCQVDRKAVGPYSIRDVGAGRVLCYQEGGDSFLEWTDERVLVYSLASRADLGDVDLVLWWAGFGGPDEAESALKDIEQPPLITDGTYAMSITRDEVTIESGILSRWVGRWTLRLDGGTYQFGAPDPTWNDRGYYVYSKGQGVVFYVENVTPCVGKAAIYQWRLERNSLVLSRIQDQCVGTGVITNSPPFDVHPWMRRGAA